MSVPRFAWMVSYPRSGNTWLRLMIASLMQGGAPVDINAPKITVPIANRGEFDDLFGIDSTILTDEEMNRTRPLLYSFLARRFQGPLILRKVHDRCWRNGEGERMFPPELSLGAVYLARDPRDVAVSYAHFAGVGVDEMIGRMQDPAMTIPTRREHRLPQFPQPLGTWSEHVLTWLDDSDMPVCLVRYEDLLAEPVEQLSRVAIFLGVSPGAVREAAAAAEFGVLGAQEEHRGFREMADRRTRFFRQGRAGAWRSVLSAAQAERLQQDHGEVMARLGYL